MHFESELFIKIFLRMCIINVLAKIICRQSDSGISVRIDSRIAGVSNTSCDPSSVQ